MLEQSSVLNEPFRNIDSLLQDFIAKESHFQVYKSICDTYVSKGNLDAAIKIYRKFTAQFPEHAEGYRELGIVQERKKDFQGETDSYKKAIRLDPDQPSWVYFVLGQLLYKRGNIEEALSVFEQASNIYPDKPEGFRWLGLCREKAGDETGEISAYLKALALDDKEPEWVYLSLVNRLKRQDNPILAEQIENQRKKIYATNYVKSESSANGKSVHMKNAPSIQQKTLQESKVERAEIALRYEKTGDWNNALDTWKTCLEDNRHHPTNIRGFLRSLRRLRKTDEACGYIKDQQLLQKNLFETTDLAIEVANCFREGGELDDAIAIWEKLYSMKTVSDSIRIGYSRTLESNSNYSKAAKVLQEIQSTNTLEALFWFYQRRNLWQEMISTYEQWTARYEKAGNVNCLLSYLKALLAADREDFARSCIAENEDRLKQSHNGKQALAWRLQSLDQFAESREYWGEIIQDDSQLAKLLRDDFSLNRLDQNQLSSEKSHIFSVLCVRNEMKRLPFILDYHKQLGVDRFYVIDNGSDDGTIEYLLSRNDTHIFQTFDSYAESKFGVTWINFILDSYCHDHWCVLVDADEMLVYPDSETVKLPQLCRYLDQQDYRAMHTHTVDMYSGNAIKRASTTSKNQSLLEVAQYFDANTYRYVPTFRCPDFKIVGGARERIFWEDKTRLNDSPPLNKVPVVKWFSGLKHIWSAHWIMPVRIADVSGALLHFKFLDDFHENAIQEIERNEHHSGAGDYRRYAQLMDKNDELSLLDFCSVRYKGSGQLVKLQLMKTSEKYQSFLHSDF